MGAVISLPSFRRQFDNPSTNLEGIISSMYDIGCFLGAIIAFVASEKLGRKGSIYCGTAIMVVGTVLQTSAFEKIQMILSRILTGIGNGINTCAVPIWQAECFDAKNRGVGEEHKLHCTSWSISADIFHHSFCWSYKVH